MMTILTIAGKPSHCTHDESPQHPLDRLYPLRTDVQLRKNTFKHWPKSANASAEDLCDNGFYYTGINDKVQCAFCGGMLSGWTKEDDIFHEHARHFGQCELVRLKQGYSSKNHEFSSPLPSNQRHKEAPGLSSDLKPHNSQYSLYSDRLHTFQTWVRGTNQKPSDLAATGLYYKGTGDKCQCYMCGGILSGWEAGDIPKNEHKRWFPKCPLV